MSDRKGIQFWSELENEVPDKILLGFLQLLFITAISHHFIFEGINYASFGVKRLPKFSLLIKWKFWNLILRRFAKSPHFAYLQVKAGIIQLVNRYSSAAAQTRNFTLRKKLIEQFLKYQLALFFSSFFMILSLSTATNIYSTIFFRVCYISNMLKYRYKDKKMPW